MSLGNPNLFHALTQNQAEAAKAALSSPIKNSKDDEYQRYFNLDIAKILYVFLLELHECVGINMYPGLVFR